MKMVPAALLLVLSSAAAIFVFSGCASNGGQSAPNAHDVAVQAIATAEGQMKTQTPCTWTGNALNCPEDNTTDPNALKNRAQILRNVAGAYGALWGDKNPEYQARHLEALEQAYAYSYQADQLSKAPSKLNAPSIWKPQLASFEQSTNLTGIVAFSPIDPIVGEQVASVISDTHAQCQVTADIVKVIGQRVVIFGNQSTASCHAVEINVGSPLNDRQQFLAQLHPAQCGELTSSPDNVDSLSFFKLQ